MKKLFILITMVSILTSCGGDVLQGSDSAIINDSTVEHSQSGTIPPNASDLPLDPLIKINEYLDSSRAEKLTDFKSIFSSLDGVWFDISKLEDGRSLSSPFLQFSIDKKDQFIHMGEWDDGMKYNSYKVLEGYKIKEGVYHFTLEFLKSTLTYSQYVLVDNPVLVVDFGAENDDKISVLSAVSSAEKVVTSYTYYGSDVDSAIKSLTLPTKELIATSPDGLFNVYSISYDGGGEGWWFTMLGENAKTGDSFIVGDINGFAENFMDFNVFWNSENELCFSDSIYRYTVINFNEKRVYHPIKSFEPITDDAYMIHDKCLSITYDKNDKQIVTLTMEFDSKKISHPVFVEIYSETGEHLKRFETGILFYDYKHVEYRGAKLSVDTALNTVYLDARDNSFEKKEVTLNY